MGSHGWSRTLPAVVAAVWLAGCEIELGGGDDSSDLLPSDWWRCPERLAGSWTFGRAPYGCDIEQFGSAEVVRSGFSAYIFDDDEPRDNERLRYMDEFHAFLRDEAADYLRSRRPEASDEEVAQWQLAVFATANQESFWTHYREAALDGTRLLTMIRGDAGHGHGLMQVDDRYHTDAIESGYGWRLDDNLIYALDIYFAGWERAPAQWCVASADNWEARARSAYSAYNGGPGQICRWTDPSDRWAQNDEGFYNKYTLQEWRYYVAD